MKIYILKGTIHITLNGLLNQREVNQTLLLF